MYGVPSFHATEQVDVTSFWLECPIALLMALVLLSLEMPVHHASNFLHIHLRWCVCIYMIKFSYRNVFYQFSLYIPHGLVSFQNTDILLPNKILTLEFLLRFSDTSDKPIYRHPPYIPANTSSSPHVPLLYLSLFILSFTKIESCITFCSQQTVRDSPPLHALLFSSLFLHICHFKLVETRRTYVIS